MKKKVILIDTHVFLWALDRKVSQRATDFLNDTESNEFLLSHVSAWEIAIKFGSGKLKLPISPEIFVPDRVSKARLKYLAIDLHHVLKVYSLPAIHKDPFDRLLVSQSKIEDIPILTADPIFSKYKIKTVSFDAIS